jgi:hypothetical protein
MPENGEESHQPNQTRLFVGCHLIVNFFSASATLWTETPEMKWENQSLIFSV